MKTDRPAYLDAAHVNWAAPASKSLASAEPTDQPKVDETSAPSKPAQQQRVLDTLEACGPLSMSQLTQALDCSIYTATSLIKQLGDQVQVIGKASATRYCLAGQTPPRTPRASTANTVRKSVPPPPPAGVPELFCALSNSCELVVRIDDELRMLSRQQTLELAAFFKRFELQLKAG